MTTAGAASVAAVTGVVTVGGYADSVTGRYGPLRPVVVTTSVIEGDRTLTPRVIKRSTQLRRIPSRFVPAGTLADSSGAIGLESVADLPPGSYLASGLLRPPDRPVRPASRAVSRGLRPVEVTVHGAGAIPPQGGRFEVLVTPLDDRSGTGRTRVVTRSAAMIGRASPASPEAGSTSTTVTLAVPRRHAIRLIDAEARGERLTLLAVDRR